MQPRKSTKLKSNFANFFEFLIIYLAYPIVIIATNLNVINRIVLVVNSENINLDALILKSYLVKLWIVIPTVIYTLFVILILITIRKHSLNKQPSVISFAILSSLAIEWIIRSVNSPISYMNFIKIISLITLINYVLVLLFPILVGLGSKLRSLILFFGISKIEVGVDDSELSSDDVIEKQTRY